MNRPWSSLMLAASLALSSAPAFAADGLSEFPPKVLPVLLKVDAQGRITDVSPAIRLAPAMERLLRANLDEMVGRPAVDRDGRPIPSQFVVNLALVTSPRPDGKFDAHFSYVSNVPVPAGSWYWVHTDGRQLALASQGSASQQQRLRHQGDSRFYVPGQFNAPAGRGTVAPSSPAMPVSPPSQPANVGAGAGGAGGTR